MPIDPSRVQAVFLAAVESKDPAERAEILNAQCAGDAELRSRVEALLQAHDQSNELPGVGPLDFPLERQATVVGSTTASCRQDRRRPLPTARRDRRRRNGNGVGCRADCSPFGGAWRSNSSSRAWIAGKCCRASRSSVKPWR